MHLHHPTQLALYRAPYLSSELRMENLCCTWLAKVPHNSIWGIRWGESSGTGFLLDLLDPWDLLPADEILPGLCFLKRSPEEHLNCVEQLLAKDIPVDQAEPQRGRSCLQNFAPWPGEVWWPLGLDHTCSDALICSDPIRNVMTNFAKTMKKNCRVAKAPRDGWDAAGG